MNEEISFEDQDILIKKQFVTYSPSGAPIIIRFDFPDIDDDVIGSAEMGTPVAVS